MDRTQGVLAGINFSGFGLGCRPSGFPLDLWRRFDEARRTHDLERLVALRGRPFNAIERRDARRRA